MSQCIGLINGTRQCTRQASGDSFYCNNCVHGQDRAKPIKGVSSKYGKNKHYSKKLKKKSQ